MGELQSDFCKNLTEFYQISLKNLPHPPDVSPQLMACMKVAYEAWAAGQHKQKICQPSKNSDQPASVLPERLLQLRHWGFPGCKVILQVFHRVSCALVHIQKGSPNELSFIIIDKVYDNAALRFCLSQHHRVLTQTRWKWILYESCHKFFMKATQILYAFYFAQHWVGESNSCVRTFWTWYYIYLFFTLKDSSLFSVNLGSAECFRI